MEVKALVPKITSKSNLNAAILEKSVTVTLSSRDLLVSAYNMQVRNFAHVPSPIQTHTFTHKKLIHLHMYKLVHSHIQTHTFTQPYSYIHSTILIHSLNHTHTFTRVFSCTPTDWPHRCACRDGWQCKEHFLSQVLLTGQRDYQRGAGCGRCHCMDGSLLWQSDRGCQ